MTNPQRAGGSESKPGLPSFDEPRVSDGAPAESKLTDWPHAPVHRSADAAVYMITAGTLGKRHLFRNNRDRHLLVQSIFSTARACRWDLEAWAVFANHYHFVVRGSPLSAPLGTMVHSVHSRSARQLNESDGTSGRRIWFNYWDTRLTYQHSYLARLKYVHHNAVKHGLVSVPSDYPWCSANWFEREASPAQVKTIYAFKIDRLNVPDDF